MKGQMDKLPEYIILILAVILVATVVIFILKESGKEIDDVACKTSVQSVLGVPKLGETIGSIKCDRVQVEINEDNIGEAPQIIGDRIGQCWSNMGGDASDKFESDWFGAGHNPCLICAEISFDLPPQQIRGVADYMKASEKFGGLWDFVYGDQPDLESPIVEYRNGNWVNSTLDTQKQYTMIYRVYRESEIVNFGFLADDREPIILVVPGQDLKEMQCTYFYN